MHISDWSSDVFSSDLGVRHPLARVRCESPPRSSHQSHPDAQPAHAAIIVEQILAIADEALAEEIEVRAATKDPSERLGDVGAYRALADAKGAQGGGGAAPSSILDRKGVV